MRKSKQRIPKTIICTSTHSLIATGLLVISCISWGATITDTMLSTILNKKLPTVLHEEKKQKWDYGTYSFTIIKNGAPTLTSGQSTLQGKLPVTIKINGSANLLTLTAHCKTTFNTEGEVHITPTTTDSKYTAEIALKLPIPETVLDCMEPTSGMKTQLSITTALRKLFADEKPKLESNFKEKIEQFFEEEGLNK